MSSQENLPETVECATHPGVETMLRCGRCGKPICPRCMVMTPGGQRCRECANLRPPPAYDVKAVIKLRAAGAAVGVGLVAGVLWSLLPRFVGLFVFLLAAGLGYVMAEAIQRVTNRKRGYVLQITAGFGILLAYFVRNYLLHGVPVVIGDIYGYLAVAIAVMVAISPLR
ncbi:MAG TPA: hypothetical protein VK821_20335 [Dehalococcoidia bacterium]|nr:hypothetical protein [Dehalococcoidia bacterium]